MKSRYDIDFAASGDSSGAILAPSTRRGPLPAHAGHHATRRWVALLTLLFNSVPVAAISLLNVHAIWFDRYELRDVGPGTVYAAYTLAAILAGLLGNAVLWLVARRQPAEARFVGLSTSVGLVLLIVLTWAGNHFMYAGTR